MTFYKLIPYTLFTILKKIFEAKRNHRKKDYHYSQDFEKDFQFHLYGKHVDIFQRTLNQKIQKFVKIYL